MKKFGLVSVSCAMAMLVGTTCAFTACSKSGSKNADIFEITIACQSEQSEQQVLEALKAEYEKTHTDTKITIKPFSGLEFESYMMGISENLDKSPNIIWTSDSYHGRWDEFFVDLRPFYETSEETDYSLYYESMLDTAATNGAFKPTKSYTGSFRADNKDSTDERSDYSLYFAPRDYNKPTILCNTKLFENLDAQYETYFGKPEESTTERLNAIVEGQDWNDIEDLFTFSKLVAERVDQVIKKAEDLKVDGAAVQEEWKYTYALDLKLSWEPTYTTILNAMDAGNVLNADGSLNFKANSEKLEKLHSYLYPAGVSHLCNADEDDTKFAQGLIFMKVVSRPIVLSYSNSFKKMYGSASLQSIQIPTEKIAAGCSGYAINRYYEDKSVTVNGVTKSYNDLCWDFIKYVITTEGQEVAGATGSNIPVLKSLHGADVSPKWKNVENLTEMNHGAWIAGGELKQDLFNIYEAGSRFGLRTKFQDFFLNFQKSDYGKGNLADLITYMESGYEYKNKLLK